MFPNLAIVLQRVPKFAIEYQTFGYFQYLLLVSYLHKELQSLMMVAALKILDFSVILNSLIDRSCPYLQL